MSSVRYLREFVNERLTAAAEEIFGVFEKTIVEYEEEIDRQRKLLDIVWKPEIKLHRIELPQQHVGKEEEVVTDQQLCNQERNSSLDQENPEPPQIKEEQEELCTSQEGEQLVLKQEADTFMLTPADEESDHREPEPDSDHQLLFDKCPVAESQEQQGSKHVDSGSTRTAELQQKKRRHSNNVDNSPPTKSHCNTQTEFVNERLTAAAEEIFRVFEKTIVEYEEEIDRQRKLLDIVWKPEIKLHRIELPQQHVCKEEEVVTDQQLCNQERNSSLDQENPEPPQIKEEQEELCTSQEGEQLVLKQEADTLMLTPADEESDHREPEPDSDHQLLFDKCPVAESQEQQGSKHVDSGSTRTAELQQKKRRHSNNVDNSPPTKSHCNTQTEFVNERLTAAAEEIFGVFEKTIVEYEEEIDRQRKLLDIVWKPEIKLHRIELPQQHVCKEEEVVTDQQLCNQERNSSLDQETPEPPQIKEEQEELCTSQEGEQLVLKQEADTLMLTPADEESDHREPEPDSDHQLLFDKCPVAESQEQQGSKHVDSGSTRTAEPQPKRRRHKHNSHSNNVDNCPTSKSHCNTQACKTSFKCDTCGKDFQYKSLLNIHLRTHIGEKPYSFETCGKRFSNKSQLKRHLRIHTSEKPYSCNICGKGFSCSDGLLVHVRTHSGEKLYFFVLCGKSYIGTSSLLVHMRIHTGENHIPVKSVGKDSIAQLFCEGT